MTKRPAEHSHHLIHPDGYHDRMKSDYELIFEQRGREYGEAMQRFPTARRAEFLRLFDGVDLGAVRTMADIPSGGGYLSAFVPDACDIDYIEPCGEFRPQNAHQTDVGLEEIVLAEASYDVVVCLAAVHHVKAKTTFLGNLYAALKPGAVLCLGDVAAGSSISRFLDDFAGRHNGTGHRGMYLEPDTVADILRALGAEILCCESKPCPWRFDTKADLLAFCRLLFGLKNLKDAELMEALEHYVGVTEHDAGVALNWRLLYVNARKPMP